MGRLGASRYIGAVLCLWASMVGVGLAAGSAVGVVAAALARGGVSDSLVRDVVTNVLLLALAGALLLSGTRLLQMPRRS